MAEAIRLATTAAADAAYAKPKAKRSARDWQLIVDHECGAIEKILLAELDHAYGEFRTIIQECKKLLHEALRLASDHPAVAELRRRADEASKKASLIARKPRKKTKNLRANAPILRANYAAAQEAGKGRGWKKRAALDYHVSIKTLNKIVFSTEEEPSEK